MKKVPVPMELNSKEFYMEDNPGHEGVHYDGNQHNGRHGSPKFSKPLTGQNITDFGGINFDNTQTVFGGGSIIMDLSDDMRWENKMGVMKDPTKKYTDIHDKMYKEVDLKPIINVPGMPRPNCNFNTHDDSYGGY